jgi:hypothetical protein
MKVIPFEPSPRPAASSAPRQDAPAPDADQARHQHAAQPFGPPGDDGHPHDEPGYGHGV